MEEISFGNCTMSGETQELFQMVDFSSVYWEGHYGTYIKLDFSENFGGFISVYHREQTQKYQDKIIREFQEIIKNKSLTGISCLSCIRH